MNHILEALWPLLLLLLLLSYNKQGEGIANAQSGAHYYTIFYYNGSTFASQEFKKENLFLVLRKRTWD